MLSGSKRGQPEAENSEPYRPENITTLSGNSIELHVATNIAAIRSPAAFFDPGRLTDCLKRAQRVLSWDISEERTRQNIRIRAEPETLEDAVREVFSRLNGYPFVSSAEAEPFQASAQPLVSCIILLTANDLFVANQLVPSIIGSSRGFAIEILIVHNGPDLDLSLFRQFDVSTSEFACVSKGYNVGVNRARGKYVAIFHDDCVLVDPTWIPKFLSLFNQGYAAVSPEVQQMPILGELETLAVAKNVPLVIERKHLLGLGAYDETYYIGFEDFDLTYQILSTGQRFSQVDLQCFHFKGMSTRLMFGESRSLYKRLFALNLLPMKVLSALRDESFARLMQDENSIAIQRAELFYFLSKFKHYWPVIGYRIAADTLNRLACESGGAAGLSLISEREAMIDFVRGAADQHGKLRHG